MSAFIPALPVSPFLPAISTSSRCHIPSRLNTSSAYVRTSKNRTVTRPTANLPLDSPSSSSVDVPNADSLKTGRNLFLEIDGHRICYDYFPGSGPAIVFLPGFFDSRWKQAKANALEIFARRKGQAILVEEYFGIGRSDGDFVKEGTLSRWIGDTIELLDRALGKDQKVVLVGMGIGGWIALNVAMKLPRRVVGIVGANPSVDFTDDLVLPSMSHEEREIIENGGSVDMKWGYTSYPIGKALVDDARKWMVLGGEKGGLKVDCPVRLIQGMMDEELPPQRVIKLMERIRTEDVVLQFVKYADHMMESEDDVRRIWEAVCELADSFFEYDLTSPSSG